MPVILTDKLDFKTTCTIFDNFSPFWIILDHFGQACALSKMTGNFKIPAKALSWDYPQTKLNG